ncbi:hypothetical protein D3C71_1909630 [compost metagenome]
MIARLALDHIDPYSTALVPMTLIQSLEYLGCSRRITIRNTNSAYSLSNLAGDI